MCPGCARKRSRIASSRPSPRPRRSDAIDDPGFKQIDTANAAHAVALRVMLDLNAISVGFAACAFALECFLLKAAMRAPRQVLDVERRHGALEADM